jgi:hypothetical protein
MLELSKVAKVDVFCALVVTAGEQEFPSTPSTVKVDAILELAKKRVAEKGEAATLYK